MLIIYIARLKKVKVVYHFKKVKKKTIKIKIEDNFYF